MVISPSESMKRFERVTALLFGMAQVAMVLALFWAFKAHLV